MPDISIRSLTKQQEWPTLSGLTPGTKLTISLPSPCVGSEETALISTFEGFDGDGLMIVASPIHRGDIFKLPIGGIYAVTYIADSTVYHINCHAKQHIREDALHFTLLERVSEAEKLERRDAFRLSVSLPCDFSRYADGARHETIYTAKMLDISAGGAKILVRVPLVIGENIRCGVTLGEHGHQELPSTVMWTAPVLRAGPGTFKAGIAFHSLSRTDAGIIVKFIYNEQFRRRKAARGASPR